MPILVFSLCMVGLIFAVFSHKRKERGGDWVQFFSKGSEAGFSIKEIEMLRQLAVQSNIEYPVALFSSQSLLEKCIYTMVRSIKMSGTGDERGTQEFLSKLYDYRTKIEMNKPSGQAGLSNSRQIAEGQFLKVLMAGSGIYKSQVVKNSSHYMTISRPVNTKISSSVQWVGAKISVYFWREDDAGYVFDTEVQDEVFSLGVPSLKINHSDSLFRTQKRKSVRIKMHKAAFLYLVINDEPPHQIETDPGLKCLLEDISDTGCAVTVGGKAEPGMMVKVQFALDNTAICMTGTVRSVSYNEEANRTKLHIEAEALPVEIRNRILGEIFGMLPEEDEDELPFRVLDDEMENFASQSGSGEKEPLTDSNLDLVDSIPMDIDDGENGF